MNNTLIYSGNRKVVVQFVKELLRLSNDNLQSITITRPEKLGDYCVSIVTDGSWDDTVVKMAQSYSKLRTVTSPENTLDTSSLPE